MYSLTDFIKIPPGLNDRFRTLLAEAMKCDEADKGNLQFYNENEKLLRIIAYSGFSEKFLHHFAAVKPFDSSVCGRAVSAGRAVFISDVFQDLGFEPHKEIAKEEGFAAVLSLPIFDDERMPLGVLSLHYMEPKWTWNLNRLDNVIKEVCHSLHELREHLRNPVHDASLMKDSANQSYSMEDNLA